MNKISLFSGCAAAAVLMTAGCRPELAQGNYGSEEQQWQDVISASYSGHRPPRIAPPAIVDRASQEALEKQRMQQENAKNTDAVSEVSAPGDDKNDAPAVKETSAAEVVDSAAEKTPAKDLEAADRKDEAKKADAPKADDKKDEAKKADAPKADEKKAEAKPADLEYDIYVVKPGDNPGSIAQKYYGKASYASLIMKANPQIKDARQIQIGTKLKVPKL